MDKIVSQKDDWKEFMSAASSWTGTLGREALSRTIFYIVYKLRDTLYDHS